MWENRPLKSPNRSLADSQGGNLYLGTKGATHCFGRGTTLRRFSNRLYNRKRTALDHKGPSLRGVFEACQEQQLSYGYRHGATSYGAFTYSLAKVLRDSRKTERNLYFTTLSQLIIDRLRAVTFDQDPCLVDPPRVLLQPLASTRPGRRRRNR
jgi:hypothetical protein